MSVEAITYSKTLTVGHRLKGLLFLIAENTFNDTGVCKVGQKVLVEESEIPERTLRRFLEALERAGAIKRARRGVPFKGGRQTDEIELVGFLEWLRINRPIKAAKVAGLPPDQSGHCWPQRSGQQVAASLKTRTSTVQETPLPRDAGESEDFLDFEDEVADEAAGEISDDETPLDAAVVAPPPRGNQTHSTREAAWIDELREGGASEDVLWNFIGPLLNGRRFSSQAPVQQLRQAVEAAERLSLPQLQKALGDLMGAKDGATGKPIRTIKPDRMMQALGAVEKGGLMIAIKPATHPEQWKRWLAYNEANDKPAYDFMIRFGVLQVASDFPPATVTPFPTSHLAKGERAA